MHKQTVSHYTFFKKYKFLTFPHSLGVKTFLWKHVVFLFLPAPALPGKYSLFGGKC